MFTLGHEECVHDPSQNLVKLKVPKTFFFNYRAYLKFSKQYETLGINTIRKI